MSDRLWQRDPDGEIARSPEPAPLPEDEERPARPKRAHALPALKLGFRDSYDYLGAVLFMSLLGMGIGSVVVIAAGSIAGRLFGRLPGQLPVFLSMVTALLGLTLIGGPLLAGCYRFARNACARDEPDLFDLTWGLRAALKPSIALAAAQFFGTLLLAGNAVFYLSVRQPVLMVLGALFAYLLAFWLLMIQYQWPLLVIQESEAKPARAGAAIRKSALLVLDNLGFTLVIAAVGALVSAVLGMTLVGAALLWLGTTAMLQTQATRELLRRYELLPPDPTLDPVVEEAEH
jgi:hypothetical protein